MESIALSRIAGLLAPAEEAKVPGVSFTGGSTLKRAGGGLYRQMEVIAMAVLAILIGVGAIALVFLGIFFVMAAAWVVMSAL